MQSSDDVRALREEVEHLRRRLTQASGDLADESSSSMQAADSDSLSDPLSAAPGRWLHALPSAVYIRDIRTGQNVFVNQWAARLLGYAPDEFASLSRDLLPQLMHLDDRARARALDEAFGRQMDDAVREIEYRMQHRSGEWRWFWSRDSVWLRDAHGCPTHVIGTALDITERKRTETDLQLAINRYQVAEEAAGGYSSLWDIRHRRVTRSRAVEAVSGYAREELPMTWQAWTDLVHPADRVAETEEQAVEWVRRRAQDHCTRTYRFRHKDGRWRWLMERERIFRDAHGEPDYVIGQTIDITERHEAETALKLANYRFQVAEEAIRGFSFQFDIETGRVTRSAGLTRVLGYGPSELEEAWESWARLIHPDDLLVRSPQEALAYLTTTPDTGYSNEYRARHKDGRWVWLLEQAIIVRDDQGRTRHVVGQTVDISARKEAADRLRTSEERLRLATEASGLGYHDYDVETSVSVWSPRAYALMGVPSGTPITMKIVIDLVHPDDRARVEAAMRAALDPAGSGAFAAEFRIRRADTGEVRWIDNHSQTHFDEEGSARKPVRNVGVLIDITDRKRAEEELRDSEERFRVIAETANEGIWLFDLLGRTTFANRYLADLLGCSLAELFYRPLTDFCFEADRPRVQTCLARNARGQRQRFDFRLRRADGAEVVVLVGTSPIHSAKGIVGMIGAFADITEHKRQADQTRLVAEVTRAVTETLDIDRSLQHVAELLAPHIADWCAINLVKDGGAIELSALAHANAERQADLRALAERHPLGPASPHGTPGVIRTGQTALLKLEEALPTDAPQDFRILGTGPLLIVPLRTSQRTFGALTLAREHPGRVFDPSEVALAEEIGRRIALAADNARLYAESQAWNVTLEQRVSERTEALRESQAQLRLLSARQLQSLEQERRRIAQEIHDELGGTLTGLKMVMARLRQRHALVAQDDDMDTAYGLMDSALLTMRRIASELRPAMLDSLGLIPALEWQAREFSKHSGIACGLDLTAEDLAFSEDVCIALFRVFQEALTNVARHSGATRVETTLRTDGHEVLLRVRDNGHGFSDAPNRTGGSLGLLGMRERIEHVGGSFSLSTSPGRGTSLLFRVPRPTGAT